MVVNRIRQIDRINAGVAFGVWLTVFSVYLLTKAVTLTFWDCGEFIACCHTLGIPHPPGTPLYVLVGRLFAVLPLYADAAARINVLSVLSSSFTALFAYLCGVRIIRLWSSDWTDNYRRFLTYAGAACGALFLAFGKTQWGNAGEAEVYGLSMLIFFVMIWVTLVYFQRSEARSGDSLMLIVIYLAFLGIGVHMTTFLALPVCGLFFILNRHTPARAWMIVAGAVLFELYLIFALSSRTDEVPHYVPVLMVFVIYLLYLFSQEKIARLSLGFVAGYLLTVAPLVGQILVAFSGSASKTADMPLLSYVSMSGGAGLIIFTIYAIIRSRSRRDISDTERQQISISAILVSITALMVLIPAIRLRGYTMFLLLSAIVLVSLGVYLSKHIRWPVLIAIAGASAVMIGVMPFLYGLAATAILCLILAAVTKSNEWRTALLVLLVAGLGYSVHLFLPIRSSQKPMLDHSALSGGFTITADFLDRKQYTSQSMMERMFVRRGEWVNQFGNYRRMGFWGFFSDQFGLDGPRFMSLFLLGILGLWETVRRAPQVGLMLTLLAVIGSIGLVLYMNFADGTRQHPVTGQDYIEVRDRDYFFIPAFLMFGLAIGLGVTGFIAFIRESLAKSAAAIQRVVRMCSALLFLLPVYALAGNYWESDRSRNYVAYDYAANMLDSADPDAVLFTYGDNDTFPLWCLQEAFGFRKDVRVVNLSLAGSKWYIRQVREYMKVDLGNVNQIDRVRAYQTPDGQYVSVSDQVRDAIIENNVGERPINFSTTVPPSNRKYHGNSIENRLVLSGLVWRFGDSTGRGTVAVDDCLARYYDRSKFRIRGLIDPTIYKDPGTMRMVSSYTDGIVVTGDSLRRSGRLDEAEQLAQLAYDSLPYDDQVTTLLGAIYADGRKTDKLEYILTRTEGEPRKWLTIQLARLKNKLGQKAEAEALLNQLLLTYPNYRPAFQELGSLYNESLQYSKLRTLFEIWLQANPGDTEIRGLVGELERVAKARGLTDTIQK